MTIVGFIGAAALMLLPGAWLAFSARGEAFGFWSRLAMATVLSPAAVLFEYHILRAAGLPFDMVAALIPAINLPAVWLIGKAWEKPEWPQGRVLLAWLLVLALPAIYLSAWVLYPDIRANWGHAWYHTGLVYRITSASGFPEEPQLAGIDLGYPWTLDLFIGLFSRLIDEVPNSAYIWTNLVWLAATLGLVARITAMLGGAAAARTLSIVWLCFGINALGPVAYAVLPDLFVETYPIWGDARYTPWVRKYAFFAGTALGTSIIAALALIVARPWSRISPFLLTAALLVALAVSYPLLFPVGVLLVAGRATVDAGRHLLRRDAVPGEGVCYPLGTILIGCAAFVAFFSLVTANREGATVLLPTLWSLKIKAATSLVVCGPLALGAVVAFRFLDRDQIERGLVFVLTAIGCLFAYAMFDIQYPANEYKYVFQIGVCLAPLAAIASHRLAARLGRAAVPVLIMLAAALAWPAGMRFVQPGVSPFGPVIERGHFALALRDDEPFAAVSDAIRGGAPEDAVLITGSVDLDLTAVTGRPLYVPIKKVIFGLGMNTDDLLTRTIGYPTSLVQRRRAVAEELFASADPAVRAALLNGIRDELHRPLILVLDVDRDVSLDAWLGSRTDLHLLHRDAHFAAWIMGPAGPELGKQRGLQLQ
jgi:hypothetical protein